MGQIRVWRVVGAAMVVLCWLVLVIVAEGFADRRGLPCETCAPRWLW